MPPIRTVTPRPGKPRLICFPYAGATARIFDGWGASLSSVEVSAYEAPGRGRRMNEPLLESIDGLTGDVMSQLTQMLDRPYVIFGHSMGALLAFTIARALQSRRLPLPRAVIISSASAPTRRRRYEHTDDAILDRVRRLGGNGDPAFLDSDDYRELFLPIIKADFAVVDSFACDAGQHIACDLVLCGGAADPEVSILDLVAWTPFTQGHVTRKLIAGGHFAPWENASVFLGFLKDVLDRYAGSGRTPHWEHHHEASREVG